MRYKRFVVGKTFQVMLRLEPEMVERADRIAELIGKAGAVGVVPSRAAVMREALDRGLAAMEAAQTKRTKR